MEHGLHGSHGFTQILFGFFGSYFASVKFRQMPGALQKQEAKKAKKIRVNPCNP
jgi:hypothetical protein